MQIEDINKAKDLFSKLGRLEVGLMILKDETGELRATNEKERFLMILKQFKHPYNEGPNLEEQNKLIEELTEHAVQYLEEQLWEVKTEIENL